MEYTYPMPVRQEKDGESYKIKYAGISDRFPAVLAEIVSSVLKAGHIGLCYEIDNQSTAEAVAEALGNENYKISRYTFADGTEPTPEAADDIVNAPDSVRLLICAGGGAMCDIVKYAAKIRETPWIYVPVTPDIRPGMDKYCIFGYGVSTERKECVYPVAVIADCDTLNSCTGRDKAAAYGDLMSEKLHALEYEFENVVCSGGHDARGVSELYKICREAMESDRTGFDLAKSSIRAGMNALKYNLHSMASARVAAAVTAAVSDDGRSVSENCFAGAYTLGKMYERFLSYKGSDVFIPPDRTQDVVKLCRMCGGDRISAISELRAEGEYDKYSYVLKEYRDDLVTRMRSAISDDCDFARTFRRLYDDAGYWLGKYIRPSDMTWVASLSLALLPEASLGGMAYNSGLFMLMHAEEKTSPSLSEVKTS